jgi:hypothetical protein
MIELVVAAGLLAGAALAFAALVLLVLAVRERQAFWVLACALVACGLVAAAWHMWREAAPFFLNAPLERSPMTEPTKPVELPDAMPYVEILEPDWADHAAQAIVRSLCRRPALQAPMDQFNADERLALTSHMASLIRHTYHVDLARLNRGLPQGQLLIAEEPLDVQQLRRALAHCVSLLLMIEDHAETYGTDPRDPRDVDRALGELAFIKGMARGGRDFLEATLGMKPEEGRR